ncbi:MAG TPA: hypothetical protein VFQ69_11820 [Rhizomicrobium sp.]|nr:hypothetical protein [Rhizomicrobium sp.]
MHTLRRPFLFVGLTLLVFGLLGPAARSGPAREEAAFPPSPAACEAPVKAAVAAVCRHGRFGIMLVSGARSCGVARDAAPALVGAVCGL